MKNPKQLVKVTSDLHAAQAKVYSCLVLGLSAAFDLDKHSVLHLDTMCSFSVTILGPFLFPLALTSSLMAINTTNR